MQNLAHQTLVEAVDVADAVVVHYAPEQHQHLSKLFAGHKQVFLMTEQEHIVHFIRQQENQYQHIIVMSNRGFHKICDELVQELESSS